MRFSSLAFLVLLACGTPQSPNTGALPVAPKLGRDTYFAVANELLACRSRLAADASRASAISETRKRLAAAAANVRTDRPLALKAKEEAQRDLEYFDNRERNCRLNCAGPDHSENCVSQCFTKREKDLQGEARLALAARERRIRELDGIAGELESYTALEQLLKSTAREDYQRCMDISQWDATFIDFGAIDSMVSDSEPLILPFGELDHGLVSMKALSNLELADVVQKCSPRSSTPGVEVVRDEYGSCSILVELDILQRSPTAVYCLARFEPHARSVALQFSPLRTPEQDTYYWRYSLEGYEIGLSGKWKEKHLDMGDQFVGSLKHERSRAVRTQLRNTVNRTAEQIWTLARQDLPKVDWSPPCLPWRFSE